MTDNVVVWDLRSFFGLDDDFIFSVEELVMLDEAIHTLIESFHGFLESVKESVEIFDNKVLLDGIVEHIGSCPIDIKIGVFDEVIIEETYKVTGVLKLMSINIVDLKWGEYNGE